MSSFEICLIVGIILAPIVAIIFILPKRKKKEQANVVTEAKVTTPTKSAETKPVDNSEVYINEHKIDNDELINFAVQKSKESKMPKRVELPDDFKDLSFDYHRDGFDRPIRPNRTIKEQIDKLSPELKALLIAGVLDRKDD